MSIIVLYVSYYIIIIFSLFFMKILMKMCFKPCHCYPRAQASKVM